MKELKGTSPDTMRFFFLFPPFLCYRLPVVMGLNPFFIIHFHFLFSVTDQARFSFALTLESLGTFLLLTFSRNLVLQGTDSRVLSYGTVRDS
ncbi:hypothetical protein CROQUDRAFT_365828 [Cronartium quercuum f. sp. fusiforme G11]|uniref:Uncharacterized protein n=1 Tax=Cronartium quercuum f. sp. fusiforme G11 TaxID=708437 RepID=A0A9P6T5W7_9BASI|nr:hypothetical protein CROQUDRAFT_365828 [Cronartium quercuum f. sp. fusiforme G11]